MDINVINASKIGAFKTAINKQADEEIAELTAKIRENRDAAGKAKAEAAAREAESKLRAEQNAAEAYYKKESSRCDFETTKAILAHRTELVDSFFGELGEDLKAFAKSEKYKNYLKNALSEIDKELGECVIIAAPTDVDTVSALTDKTVKTDSTIAIGGICAANEEKGLFLDFTLDKALADEKEKFADKPELRL